MRSKLIGSMVLLGFLLPGAIGVTWLFATSTQEALYPSRHKRRGLLADRLGTQRPNTRRYKTGFPWTTSTSARHCRTTMRHCWL